MSCPLCPAESGCSCLAPDTVLAGRYRVVRRLGEGSRKTVLLVEDQLLEREVAFCLSRSADPGEALRLRREAALTAGLGASGRVVAVHDVGAVGEVPYLVAQHLPGGSLRDRLQSGPLPVPQVVRLAEDLALALEEMHRAGLVHRDVKPGNAWLTADGRAVLGDLGLAVREGMHDEEPGLVAGTAAYLPPEQALGQPPDRRGDLYSLGVLVWELLCGRPPRPEPVLQALLDGVHETPHEPPSRHRPEVPAALDALVLSLLRPRPEDRPGSAAAVAEQLAGLRTQGTPGRGRSTFVGREEELALLRSALAEAAGGSGGTALVLGEAGMGKTRLVAELAKEAGTQGALVLQGRCPDTEGAPAYWPWTQVLRAAVDALGEHAVRGAAGAGADLLGALLEDLGDAPVSLEGGTARFRLFDVVGRLLLELGRTRPVLVVLDDVHWADLPSLALTRHVGREAALGRVLLVACARDVASPDPAVAEALGRLAGSAGRTLQLTGLPPEPAAQLVEQLAGLRPDEQALQVLHDQTEGNPFFLAELVRLLVAEDRLQQGAALAGGPGVPTGVREVLRLRFRQVSPECVALLRTCAVLGREVPLDVLGAVDGRPWSELLARLDEAVAARLLVVQAGTPVVHRFPHALVQEALYDDLPALERARVHRAAGQALAARAGEEDTRAAEIASHFVRAAALGDTVPAVRWSIRAAQRAKASGAWEEAVAHLERAVALTPTGASPVEGDLLMSLGEALCLAGRTDDGRAVFSQVADRALVAGDAELLARAALGYGVGLGGFGFAEHADGELLSLLEEALDGLPAGDSALRVRVLARLATELYFTPFRRRRLDLSAQALEMAQRLGDPSVELLALYSRTWALLGPDGLEERRRTADKVLRLARVLRDEDMVFRAHHLRLNVLLEAGEREQVEAEVASARRLAEGTRHPVHAWQVAVSEAMLALLDGDVTTAEQLADAAVGLGRRGHQDMAFVVYGAQLLVARWARGRLGEVLEPARSFADSYPHAPAWRAALAYSYVEVGRDDAARAELAVLGHRGFADLPRDGNFLTATTLAALTAARLGDVERCAQLRTLLEPYADRCVVIAAGAVAFLSVEVPLAVTSTVLGDHDRALDHLARAERRHRARGAHLLMAATDVEKVGALLARDAPGDSGTALELARRTISTCEAMGMEAHAARLRALVPAVTSERPVTVLLTDVAGSAALTERLGEVAVHGLLAGHRAQAERLAKTHGGWALKSLGDGVLLAFPDASAALACAAQLQHDAAAGGLPLRLGVHTGTVLLEGESMYGRTMVLAFRIADRARAGEVLLSAATRAAVLDDPSVRVDRGRRLRLKGIDEPVLVHRLLWQAGRPYADEVELPDQPSARSASTASKAFRAAMSTGSQTGAKGGA